MLLAPAMKACLLASVLLVVTGCVAGDADDEPDDTTDFGDEDEPQPEDEPGADVDAADAIPSCTAVTQVILYSESTNAFTLPAAFAAHADRCTHYYVYLPALTDDKTQVRATADKVHALGPNFHAMAEFHWAAWRDWVARSPGTRDFRLAGQAFRARMAAAGYGARDTWAINEFPSSTRSGASDVWSHERAAVRGLAEGDGTRIDRGVVFLAGIGQTLQNFSVYKPNVER